MADAKKKTTGGNICCLPNCSTNSVRDKGVGLFMPTTRKGEYYEEWNKKIYDVILRYRVNDTNFKALREKKKIFVCEKHYKPDDIELTPTGKKSVKLCALPSVNLPMKSHQTPHTSRKPPTERITVINDTTEDTRCYKTLSDLRNSVTKLKLSPEWSITERENSNEKIVLLRHRKEPELLHRYELIIDSSLGFSVHCYGWPLRDDHDIYKRYCRSMLNVRVPDLKREIMQYLICAGLGKFTPGCREHFIQYESDPLNEDDNPGFKGKKYFRPDNCQLLTTESVCSNCTTTIQTLKKKEKKSLESLNKPLHPNTPLSSAPPEKLIAALKVERKKNTELNKFIERSGVTVDAEMHSDISSILDNNFESLSPFVKMFWEEQKIHFNSNPSGRRYHPMLIRFALSIATKSPAAYEEIRNSGVLKLPSMRTLKDYRNLIQPRAGFNPAVVQDLIKETKNFTGSQRFVTLSFDEMKIQADLVYNRHTGELVGFTDLGEPDINMGALKDFDELATHVLVFYLRGIKTNLKYSFAYFATKGLAAFQLLPIFWRAINILEITCSLPVIVVVCDAASCNRNFFRLHAKISAELEVVYKVRNLFAPERWIWFLSDVPHLLKTLRNCLFHSKPSGSRYMWNDGSHLEWGHISRIVNDQFMSTKGAPKLTPEHINLNSYSIMNVRLAAQTLSSTVAIVLRNYYPGTEATADFCDMVNKFFDILNVRSQRESIRKRNDDMKPFTAKNDERLEWLKSSFLSYFSKWKEGIKMREGFSTEDKKRMFISSQTYEGLRITVMSMVEIIPFLLDNEFDFVLTEKFNQDCLEQNFGTHRSVGGRSQNPNLYRFGYDENAMRVHRSVVPVKGNVAGAFVNKKKPCWFDVDDSPIEKRAKKSKK